ncbi:MAG: hypothetical protein AB7K35_09240 [Pseudorhodoplanes sp.]
MPDTLAKVTDPNVTLRWHATKVGRWFLGYGLTGLVAGSALLWLQPDDFSVYKWFMLYATLLISAVMTLYGLHRWLGGGKPLLILSPAGLRIHVDFVKDIDIPWRAVRGVSKDTVTGSFRGQPVRFEDVTMVLVSKAFYDRHIHIRSWLSRGPGWYHNFIPKGDMVQVALHHAAMNATSAELYTAVETRLRAFGDPDAVPAKAAPLASLRPLD